MLQLNIYNKVEEMAQLGPFMDEVGNQLAVSPDVIFQMSLALDEALANSVNYAYPENSQGLITLTADKHDGQLVFQLIDAGVPFDPTKGGDVDITLSAEERPIGGLGIFLIKQMMDSVSYERNADKNVLTMVKKL